MPWSVHETTLLSCQMTVRRGRCCSHERDSPTACPRASRVWFVSGLPRFPHWSAPLSRPSTVVFMSSLHPHRDATASDVQDSTVSSVLKSGGLAAGGIIFLFQREWPCASLFLRFFCVVLFCCVFEGFQSRHVIGERPGCKRCVPDR